VTRVTWPRRQPAAPPQRGDRRGPGVHRPAAARAPGGRQSGRSPAACRATGEAGDLGLGQQGWIPPPREVQPPAGPPRWLRLTAAAGWPKGLRPAPVGQPCRMRFCCTVSSSFRQVSCQRVPLRARCRCRRPPGACRRLPLPGARLSGGATGHLATASRVLLPAPAGIPKQGYALPAPQLAATPPQAVGPAGPARDATQRSSK